MTKSPRRNLEVFDFNEEDEIVEIASAKQLKKFKSPMVDDHRILKYEFLGYVSQIDKVRVNDVGSIPCVDIDAVDGDFSMEKGVSEPPLGTLLEDRFDGKDKDSDTEAVQQSNSLVRENYPLSKLDVHTCRGSIELETEDTSGDELSTEMSLMDLAHSGSSSNDESAYVNSEAEECNSDSTPSSPESWIPDTYYPGSSHCIVNFDTDDTNQEVVLYPDYVVYQDSYYTGPQLTFSCWCIKINSSTACINQEALNLEWAVDDVIDIKCQFFQNMGMVIMNIRVISSDADHTSNANDTPGIEELKITVVDSNWSLTHRQITSLNVKYLAIWNVVLETDMDVDESDSLGPRHYFPNFDEPFEDVIYPKGDPDAVSLSKRDVDLLQPDTFINDTIIDFYIKYLKNQIQEKEKHRFHFFNSFFFRKLADMDKNPSSASDGRAAFLRVRKWTRKVNLFEKDYIFIPVNFNLHWSLIVICHPGEIVSSDDEGPDKSIKLPCILHMDSIKGSHSGLKNLVQSYLWEEWKERHQDALEEDLSSRFFNMRFLPLTLPQQENSFDCGLFLLHYLELFLAQVPVNFNPLKLTRFSNFLNADWFPPAEASLKRTVIQRLIFELLENRSHEASSSDYSDQHHYSDKNENGTGVEFLGEGCCPETNMESTTSHAGQGIEISLLSAASSLDSQSFNNSRLVLRGLLEAGATAELLGQCQSFDHRSSDYHLKGSIFPIEEDTEIGDQFMYLTSDANFQQVAQISPQTCELHNVARDSGDQICHESDIPVQADLDKAESSQDESRCASDDSDDVSIIETHAIGNEEGSSEEARLNGKNCLPMENIECLTEITGSAAIGKEWRAFEEAKQKESNFLSMENLENLECSTEVNGFAASNLPIDSGVESSQDTLIICNGNNGVLNPSCNEAPLMPLAQGSDAVVCKITCDDVPMIDGMTLDPCEEPTAKKRRLIAPAGEIDSMEN